MDEARRQFEAFILSISGIDLCKNFLLDKDESGFYTLPRTNDRWLFWKASRQALQDSQKGE
ncbi:hypothetical protein GCM10009414_20950 [Tatumella terrea]